MVVGDRLHFADPGTFNDPMETRPSVDDDVEVSELEDILRSIIQRSVAAEMRAAAQAMKLDESGTSDQVDRRSRMDAERRVAESRYNATYPNSDPATALRWELLCGIELEFLRGYERGIVSLAERDDCPLMWSHYGDQHRGVCLGYSVPERSAGNVRKVEYGGDRLVKASDLGAMLRGDEMARARVDTAVMLRKAENWKYEREWRLIGRRGTAGSPLELEEVIFGMRCKATAKYAVIRALEGRFRAVRFFEMREERATFDLRKVELACKGALFANYPARHLDILEWNDSDS